MASLPKTVSGPELAQLLGLTVRALREHCDQGHVIRQGKGRYLLAESIAAYCRHMREIAAGRGGTSGVETLTAERARLAREQADEKALRNAALRSEMISAVEATARWRQTLTAVRGRLLAVPGRVRARAPYLAREDVEIVDAEVRDALEALADGST